MLSARREWAGFTLPLPRGERGQHHQRHHHSGGGVTPFTDDNIKDAVKAWCDDPHSAAGVYGNISAWDTSEVTDMSWLFAAPYDDDFYIDDYDPRDKGGYCSTYATFNEDLSKWNVSRVTDMSRMFYEASSSQRCLVMGREPVKNMGLVQRLDFLIAISRHGTQQRYQYGGDVPFIL